MVSNIFITTDGTVMRLDVIQDRMRLIIPENDGYLYHSTRDKFLSLVELLPWMISDNLLFHMKKFVELNKQLAHNNGIIDEAKAKPISKAIVQKVIKKEGLTATMRITEKKPRAKKQPFVDPDQFSLF